MTGPEIMTGPETMTGEQTMAGEQTRTGRTLVAGVGNVFQRDDAFGVEVVRLLAERATTPGVQIRDFGIRGVHLAYDLLDGCDLFVLIDAAARGAEPGTITVLEVEPKTAPANAGDPLAVPVIDAHSLAPDDIFALLASLGGRPGRSLVVACEPADTGAGMGLTEPVQAALPHAVRAVEDILREHRTEGKGDRRDDPQAGEGGRDSRGNSGGD
jgi:hydrogenase maturation protease